jgi:hypothetical protein
LTEQAKRVEDWTHIDHDAICYYKAGGVWYLYVRGLLGNLGGHDVTENANGTITVSPSILIKGKQTIHGYLENGIWRDV